MLFESRTSLESRTQSAYVNGLSATRSLTKAEQKAWGQYMTPPRIAGFMARRAARGLEGRDIVRILEPAAGSGVLAAAAVAALLASGDAPRRIELIMYEFDDRLASCLRQLAQDLKADCDKADVRLDVRIESSDFLLSTLARARRPEVDLVIANPPYFKLSKQDPRAQAHADCVWGQPNIYGLFMAACAQVLRPMGRYCFITPRSWMSGPYFKRVREQVLRHLQLDALHVFDSREDHFTEDAVLQEAVITWGSAHLPHSSVCVSASRGTSDLETAQIRRMSLGELGADTPGSVIRIPTKDSDASIGQLRHTLNDLGLRVSTGPVVAFRAAAHLCSQQQPTSVPLLWLQHVKSMQIQWPVHKKREHILANADSAWMLVPNAPMVLLRRFSPKEDAQRVVAAPYVGQLPGDWLGLENHLNYIWRPDGQMSAQEVIGLAAYLNSPAVSDHFASVSGHTQVNASDLRQLPIPSQPELIALGQRLAPDAARPAVHAVVDSALWPADAGALHSRHAQAHSRS